MGCISSKTSQEVSGALGFLLLHKGQFIRAKSESISLNYEIGEVIGEGTFGKVYSAVHKPTTQCRAVKTIRKQRILQAKAKQRFMNEVNILKLLDHPNIIKLYEFYEDNANFYIITELCTGGELLETIMNNQANTEALAAYYFKQLISAVNYLHSLGIAHCDLKLENLLLEANTEYPILKIIDFGSANYFTAKRLAKRRGTTLYLAPEVFDSDYDNKADVWSCGVILYILLCGRMPFGGTTDEEIVDSIKRGKIKFTGTEWEGRSEDSKNLVKKMLKTNPKKRQSAQEVRDDTWVVTDPGSPFQPAQFQEVLQNLISFRTEHKLQCAVLRFIASQHINKTEITELSQVFNSLDTAGIGRLTPQDLLSGCKQALGQSISLQEVLGIIRRIDTDQNGFIDYSEFIVAAMDREILLSRERLEAAFRAFDQTRNGLISAEELRLMLECGSQIHSEVWGNLIKEADKNGDGQIDLGEFMDMMLQVL